MARRDGTGPMGNGPMTGRGMGLCNTSRPASTIGRIGLGLGLGLGFGLRRCLRRNRFINSNNFFSRR